MTPQPFISQPDATGHRTHLMFNPARGCIAGIELRNAQNQLVYSAPLKAPTSSSFAIAFRKFDLANVDNNQHFLGEVVYRITQDKSPNITSGAGWVNYRYAVSPTNTPPEAGQPALPTFTAINVDVKLSAPTDISKGWVDLDVQFTYPAQAQNGDAHTAWEVRLVYPELLLDGSAADHQLLNPVGVIGPVAPMLTHQQNAAPAGFTLPAQFAALYRLGDGAASAQGLALSATDETGHEKRLHLEARGSDVALSLRLIAPMFLKGNAFVRPDVFKVSAGDALGYGGAKMTFRLRAFHLQASTPEAVLSWHDVADLYRQWARTRTSTFWRKHNTARTTNAPVDSMSPYTVAQNYSLDGAIDFAHNPMLARWLEVHPASPSGQEPDMPGNTNETLIARLKRVKALFAGTPARLEAQLWGFEPGGFYRFLGGFPALTDLLSGQTLAIGNTFVSLAAPTPNTIQASSEANMIREHIISVLNGRSEQTAKSSKALLKTVGQSGARPLPDPLPYWWDKRREALPNPLLYGRERLSPSARISAIKYFLANEIINDLLTSAKRRNSKAGFGYARSEVIEDLISELLGPPRRQPGAGPATTRYRLADDLFSPEFPPPRRRTAKGIRPLPDPLPYWPEGKHRALLGVPLPWEVVAHKEITALGRLAQAFAELAGAGIITSVTTNPLGGLFRRIRFHGHVLPDGLGGWRRAIPNAWPQVVTTALTNKIVTATPNNNRAFYLHPDYPEANVLREQNKRDAHGVLVLRDNALTPFNGLLRRNLCPTQMTEDVYVNQWLGGVLGYGTQLIEFMLHGHDQYFCYDKTHQHIEPKPKANAAYDNVIGYGSWYVKRMQTMLARVHEAGQANNPSFTLTNEFVFPEALLPYFDEFYARNSSLQVYSNNEPAPGLAHANVFQFMFSERVTEKMDMIDGDLLAHPGYQEARKTTSPPIALPTAMLDGILDDSDVLPDFDAWRAMSKSYCDKHFKLISQGIAPSYEVDDVSYVYQRSLAATMNLRSNIFRIGAAAVVGERMLLPAEWIEQPYDFSAELVNMTVRVARLHMQFASYFRQGAMLGQVRIRSGNRTAQTWRIPLRDFSDMPPLVADVQASADPALPPPTRLLADSISRDTDRTENARQISLEQVQHQIWRNATGQLLYVFANVGNRDAAIAFSYTRGLSVGQNRNRVVYTFSGTGTPVASASKAVKLGDAESVSVPARGLVAVEIK